MEIRDTRNGSWYWVNTAVNACPHITNADKVVYGALCTFAGCAEIHPSYPEIAKRSALCERVCIRSVQKLIKVGYISVEKGGGKGNANVYNLIKVPNGCNICTAKGDKYAPFERVTNMTAKGDKYDRQRVTNMTPQLDKVIDNELDKSVAVATFNQFWEEYPKKELTKKSFEIWKRKKFNTQLKVILDFIIKAKETDRWQKGYVKQPPAFLNGECWNDDLNSYNDKKPAQLQGLDLRKK